MFQFANATFKGPLDRSQLPPPAHPSSSSSSSFVVVLTAPPSPPHLLLLPLVLFSFRGAHGREKRLPELKPAFCRAKNVVTFAVDTRLPRRINESMERAPDIDTKTRF